jgi:hypothetical protein
MVADKGFSKPQVSKAFSEKAEIQIQTHDFGSSFDMGTVGHLVLWSTGIP